MHMPDYLGGCGSMFICLIARVVPQHVVKLVKYRSIDHDHTHRLQVRSCIQVQKNVVILFVPALVLF